MRRAIDLGGRELQQQPRSATPIEDRSKSREEEYNGGYRKATPPGNYSNATLYNPWDNQPLDYPREAIFASLQLQKVSVSNGAFSSFGLFPVWS